MMTKIQLYYLTLLVPLAPLAGALIAGLFGKFIGRSASHWVTIVGVLISFVASLLIFQEVLVSQV